MATTGNLHEKVYRFIRSHVEETGKFPYTYQIAQGCNIQDRTAETVLKVLEARRLVQQVNRRKRAGYMLATRNS